MLNETIGPINDRLYRLGTRESIIYLVKGHTHMLIGGAGQWIVPKLEEQLREYRIDMSRVGYLLIGHSHFDHSGAVPYLQKKYPHIEVLASRGAAKLFAMEKAVRNMARFSGMAMEALGIPPEIDGIPLAFDGVSLSKTLADGDQIDLGAGIRFRIFETPGHSRCSIMAYAPNQKWLFPSDSLPMPINGGEELVCTASESFVDYLQSMEKVAHLPVELCGWEHYGYLRDASAENIVARSRAVTRKYKQMLKERAQPPGDAATCAKWAADAWEQATQFSFLPRPVIDYITRTMVENALTENID